MKLLNKDGKVNLHTHTYYCDGKDGSREIAEKAFALGFRALGFSGHEYAPQDSDFCMSPQDTQKYRKEVLALKEIYRGRMEIYLGVERDFFGQPDDYPYDYIIGSLHYVEKDGTLLSVDESEETMVTNVRRYFGGDYRSYVENYYALMGDVPEKTGADIVGHFDLISKFNEGNKYFDEDTAWYRAAALGALRRAAKGKPIFEINTGAAARGCRSEVYPKRFILDEIERLGCPLILSSDCHQKEYLDFGFLQVAEKLSGKDRIVLLK